MRGMRGMYGTAPLAIPEEIRVDDRYDASQHQARERYTGSERAANERTDERDETGGHHRISTNAMRARPHLLARQRPRRPDAEDEVRSRERHQITPQHEKHPCAHEHDGGH